MAILLRNPDHFECVALLAEITAQEGDVEKAIQLYTRMVELKEDYDVGYYKRANLLKSKLQFRDALVDYDLAIKWNSGYANAFCNRGVVLAALDRMDEAINSFARAIALNPQDAFAFFNRADVLRRQGRQLDALSSYDDAIALNPGYAECHFNRGLLLAEREQWDQALGSYDRCIELRPQFPQAQLSKGNVLQKLKQPDLALESYDKAIKLDPNYAEAYCNRGLLLTEMKQWQLALASLDKAVALKADMAEAYCARGVLFAELMRNELALENYAKATALKDNYGDVFQNRGNLWFDMRKYAEAIDDFERALALNSNAPYLLGMLRHAKMNLCDWAEVDTDIEKISASLDEGAAVSPPLPVLALIDSARAHHKVAEIWAHGQYPEISNHPDFSRASRGKIRIGYFSGDFFMHPVAVLMAELFENHDRSKFETVAFSFGPDTKDEMRMRLEHAFDRFIDVRANSDFEIAQLAKAQQIDIAIDLTGFTGKNRTRIFSHRAAPLQINYLGYPGSMGAGYIDYLICDPVVMPQKNWEYCTEKLILLPDSYLPNDSSREIAKISFSREQLGLPASGVIFCCFNNNYKITPYTFTSWMKILLRVQHSVLWLSPCNPTAVDNLRAQSAQLGVDPARLIFANRMASMAEHLARHRVADLFLDTLPYNAHATAIDSLWAGLPVVTQLGDSFPGRVGASLLSAAGLPELVAAGPQQYEDLASELGQDAERLAQIKHKLAVSRETTPLFNPTRFRRHLETAYIRAWARHQEGHPPDHMTIEPFTE